MELSADYLREKLRQDLEAEHVEVEDTTLNRCATSFRVLVVSAKFEGKPLLQRHRLVNECLAEELPHIHAFEQKTLTPEQWTRQRRGDLRGSEFADFLCAASRLRCLNHESFTPFGCPLLGNSLSYSKI